VDKSVLTKKAKALPGKILARIDEGLQLVYGL